VNLGCRQGAPVELEPPVAACRATYGGIRSILRSSSMTRATGILLSAAKLRTARRNAAPVRSRIAGDAIGLPECWVRKLTP